MVYKNLILSILLLFSFGAAEANQPIDWQLGDPEKCGL